MQPLPFCDSLILLKIHHNLLFVVGALKRMGERAPVTGSLSPVHQLAISQSFISLDLYVSISFWALPGTNDYIICCMSIVAWKLC